MSSGLRISYIRELTATVSIEIAACVADDSARVLFFRHTGCDLFSKQKE
jgi:hypothetical protein